MILKKVGKTEAIQCMNLMRETCLVMSFGGYEYDEINWCTFFMDVVKRQDQGDLNYMAYAVYKDSDLLGFMTCNTFQNYYNETPIMDVKDMIVDETAGRFTKAKVTAMLFDNMIKYVKSHGGKQWRADTVRTYEESEAYANFLKKRYDCSVSFSMRGTINE